MKVISSDGIGLAALLEAAGRVGQVLSDHNVTLAVGTIDGEGHPVALVVAQADGYRIGVTVEPRPRLVDVGQPEAPAPAIGPVKPRAGTTHPENEVHYFTGTSDCVCVARCCSGAHGACICLTCEDPGHGHG